MTELLTSYIDGAWLTDWSGATNELTNPATEQVTDCVALAGPAEVDAAVAAARRSFATCGTPDFARAATAQKWRLAAEDQSAHPALGDTQTAANATERR